MTNKGVLLGIAEELLDSEEKGHIIEAPSSCGMGLSLEAAYEVQRHNYDVRVYGGDVCIGKKVGYAIQALRQAHHLGEPIFAYLFALSVHSGHHIAGLGSVRAYRG